MEWAVHLSNILSRPTHQNGAIICERFTCEWLRRYALYISYHFNIISHCAEDVIGSSQGQTQFDADDGTPKYVVNIAYPPQSEESMFKTRGTYSVKKVLAGACKNFGLDFDRSVSTSLYRGISDCQTPISSAHLKLIVEFDDEDGDKLLSDCDNGDTMARAGAVPNARFIIVMDDD
jgi:hypothetical protein